MFIHLSKAVKRKSKNTVVSTRMCFEENAFGFCVTEKKSAKML